MWLCQQVEGGHLQNTCPAESAQKPPRKSQGQKRSFLPEQVGKAAGRGHVGTHVKRAYLVILTIFK